MIAALLFLFACNSGASPQCVSQGDGGMSLYIDGERFIATTDFALTERVSDEAVCATRAEIAFDDPTFLGVNVWFDGPWVAGMEQTYEDPGDEPIVRWLTADNRNLEAWTGHAAVVSYETDRRLEVDLTLDVCEAESEAPCESRDVHILVESLTPDDDTIGLERYVTDTPDGDGYCVGGAETGTDAGCGDTPE